MTERKEAVFSALEFETTYAYNPGLVLYTQFPKTLNCNFSLALFFVIYFKASFIMPNFFFAKQVNKHSQIFVIISTH